MAFTYIKNSELEQMLHILKSCETILKCSQKKQKELLFKTQFDISQNKDYEIFTPEDYYKFQYYDNEICIKYLIKQKCYVIYSNKKLDVKINYSYLFNGYNYGQYKTLEEAKYDYRNVLYEFILKVRRQERDLIPQELF